MNKYILSAALLSCLFAACEDVNDKIDGVGGIVDKNKRVVDNTLSYTLTSSDYAFFGKETYYKSQDPADTVGLKLVSQNLAFPDVELAKKYLPDFIAKYWYQYDNGSSINFFYDISSDGVNPVVTAVASAKVYELTAADYEAAGATSGYLTPSTISRIPSVLASALEAADGDMCIVKYNYSESVPSGDDGGDEAHKTNWAPISFSSLPAGSSWNFQKASAAIPTDYAGQRVRIGIRYTSTAELAGTVEVSSVRVDDGSYILPTLFVKGTKSVAASQKAVAEGKVLLLAQNGDDYFALNKIDNASGKTYGYSGSVKVAVDGGVVSSDDFDANALTLEAADGGFYVKNTDGYYLYSTGYASFSFADAVPENPAGYVWAFKNVGHSVVMTNVDKGGTVAYSTQYKSIGTYNDSKFTSYLLSAFDSDALPEGYAFADVNIGELSYVWNLDTKNKYLKASAYANKTNNEAESWLISPEIELTAANAQSVLTLDLAANFFNGNAVADYLAAFVSTDYEEGSEFVVNGSNKSLSGAASGAEQKIAVYSYENSKWSVPDDVVVVNPSDYKSMGTSYTNFSTSFKPEENLPTFLAINFPYAKATDSKVVVYEYYASGATSFKATEYYYDGVVWAPVDNSKEETSGRFLKANGVWFFDPSIVLTLPYDKSDVFAKTFYQAATDWVWENVDVAVLGCTEKGKGYVTSYGNNEYYTGSSAYYNNVDWRPSYARTQYAPYNDMSDDEVLATLKKNLISVYGTVLGILYPTATPVEGVDVNYSINFTAYYASNGGSNSGHEWTVKYKLVKEGVFEYVEDSLQPVE